MKHKIFLLFTLVVCPLLTTTTLAQEQEEALSEESAELFNLLEILNEQTEIATKTKLNADHVPGMVTVLHGSDLEARGLRTVWEALRLVPGMDPTIDNTGIKQINTRGTGQVYSSGNVKILLNDISINPGKNGLADSVLNLPVEQIERIEVVRGPGSAIYGEFAYAGVINIITRDDVNRAFAAYGSFDTTTVGLLHNWSKPENDFKFTINLSGMQSDGADVKVTEDTITNLGFPAFSHAPGSANEEAEARSAIVTLQKGELSLTAQWLENGIGDHFGINYFLPPDPDKIVNEETHRSLEARYEKQISPDLQAVIKLGYQRYLQVKDDQFLWLAPPDEFIDVFYEEDKTYASASLAWSGLAGQQLFLSAEHSSTDVLNTSMVDSNGFTFPHPVAPDTDRSISSLTLQDEVKLADNFNLTAGLRYDDYDDIGSRTTPRLAGVWHLTDRHIFKAQYARAFRPPTFYELSTTSTSSTVETSELGYIYNGINAKARATLFHSDLEDTINFDNVAGYSNTDVNVQGLELELEQRLGSRLKWAANLAYVDTEEISSQAQVPFSSNLLVNIGLIAQVNNKMDMALQYRGVKGYNRESGDPRPDMDDQHVFDLTANMVSAGKNKLSYRLGVKNMFDEDVRLPAPVILPGPLYTYKDDLPRAGRTWWAQISYAY